MTAIVLMIWTRMTCKRKAATAFLAAALSVCGAANSAARADDVTDGEIRQAIIAESIASYPGSCPCPYNIDRNEEPYEPWRPRAIPHGRL